MRSRLDWRYRPGICVFLALALLLTFSVRRLHRFSPIPRTAPATAFRFCFSPSISLWLLTMLLPPLLRNFRASGSADMGAVPPLLRGRHRALQGDHDGDIAL